MIQKRNISTFAAVLGLMAIMLLSASPAKAFKTSNPDMAAAYDQCLTNNYQGKAKNVKKCFEDFRTTYAEACFVDAVTIERAEEMLRKQGGTVSLLGFRLTTATVGYYHDVYCK